jgi:hypothetical protein
VGIGKCDATKDGRPTRGTSHEAAQHRMVDLYRSVMMPFGLRERKARHKDEHMASDPRLAM